MKDLNKLWEKSMRAFQRNVSAEVYQTYFTQLKPIRFEDNILSLEAPGYYYIEYLEHNHLDLMRFVIHNIFGESTQLQYSVYIATNTKQEFGEASTIIHKAPQVDSAKTLGINGEALDSQLNPKYTFENFFVGQCNLLARSAGEQIVEKPGKTAFNPFFVFGKSGVGKTHLINAIGLKIKEKHPQTRVLYVSARTFAKQFSDATLKNQTNDFAAFFQSIDVLIVDDIQELAAKTKSQNEFFHFFNHLQHNGKQIIMSSDKPPVDLSGFEERLLSRFKWGLNAELESPDFQLRQSILINKVRTEGLNIPKDVIDFIAKEISDNIRDLEGIIVSLLAHSMILKQEITLELAERVILRNVRIEKRSLTIESIKIKVAEFYELSVDQLVSSSRKREIAQARQIAMYLTKDLTTNSYAAIGASYGDRNHATVLHSYNTVKGLIELDKKVKKEVDMLRKNLKS